MKKLPRDQRYKLDLPNKLYYHQRIFALRLALSSHPPSSLGLSISIMSCLTSEILDNIKKIYIFQHYLKQKKEDRELAENNSKIKERTVLGRY